MDGSIQRELAEAIERADAAEERVRELSKLIEDVLYAQLGGHLKPTKDGRAVLNDLRAALGNPVIGLDS